MELDYGGGKHCLAPMVRVGTLPMRMLAAEYGADITYTEELVDHRVLRCSRVANKALGTVDLVDTSERTTAREVVFRTCPAESHRVVLQLGSSDAVRALRAAELVARDVAGLDLNMGCPKAFSVHAGMGAALLREPELAADILGALRRNIPGRPVSCKIRLLPTPAATVELARRMERAGAAAVAVHGRRQEDRPRDPARWDLIAHVAAAVQVPVLANGDVFEYADFGRIRAATGAAGVLVARAACWNASVFRPQGVVHWEEVKREYVRRCVDWDNDVKGTKHTVREMIMRHSCLEMEEGKALARCRSLADLAECYGLRQYYYDAAVLGRVAVPAAVAVAAPPVSVVG